MSLEMMNMAVCTKQEKNELERLRAANHKLGSWMSAALEDPNVCEEMKADIREWFAAQGADGVSSDR